MAGYIGSKAVNLSTTGADINGDANIDGDLSFRDNDKIKLGAGSDLQIYHDGSESIIKDAGTGNLKILATDLRINNADSSKSYITGVDGGYVNLYYNGSQKLVTTSTGIDVTGTVTADSLTVDGDIRVNTLGTPSTGGVNAVLADTSNASAIQLHNNLGVADGGALLYSSSAANFNVYNYTGAIGSETYVNRFGIANNGDISFYEDTGTTAKFFWDASAERLGIGTSSPAAALQVVGSFSNQIKFGTNTSVYTDISMGSGFTVFNSIGGNSGAFDFRDDGTSRMFIDSSGNVGIGTSSPDEKLEVYQGNIKLGTDTNTTSKLIFERSAANRAEIYVGSSNQLQFDLGGTEAMRIDSSGNLLVGTTDSNVSDNSGSSNGGINIQTAGVKGVISAAAAQAVIYLNRLGTADGDIAVFRKDGSTVGSIGVALGWFELDGGSASPVRVIGQSSGYQFASGAFYPQTDNARDVGTASLRFDDIYATNGTIQTSDRNEKQDIAELTDAEQRVAVTAKGLLRKFRWKSAVEAKGDEARTHFGIIAQDLQAAFAAEGLDAGDYAMFISSTWTDEETGEERTRMGVRYSELLAFIIGAL